MKMLSFITGKYHATSNKATPPDVIVGFSFGHRLESRKIVSSPANTALAQYILEHYPLTPKILQAELAIAYTQIAHSEADYTIPNRETSKTLLTKSVLSEATIILKNNGYKHPLLIGHANHIAKIKGCADVQLTTYAIPKDLPQVWDAHSAQIRTKNPYFWAISESISLCYYKMRGWI